MSNNTRFGFQAFISCLLCTVLLISSVQKFSDHVQRFEQLLRERVVCLEIQYLCGGWVWQGIADSQQTAMFNAITPRTRKFFEVVRRVPFWMVHLFVKIFILREIRTEKWTQNVKKTASPADRIHLSLSCISDLMTRYYHGLSVFVSQLSWRSDAAKHSIQPTISLHKSPSRSESWISQAALHRNQSHEHFKFIG